MMSKFVKALIVSVAAFSLSVPALACSCLRFENVEQQFEQSGVVFIGQVVDTGPREVKRSFWSWFTPWRKPPQPDWGGEFVTTVQVNRMLKGPETSGPVTFVHDVSGASCGVTFSAQQSGVFIRYQRSDGYLGASLCNMAQFPESDFIALADKED